MALDTDSPCPSCASGPAALLPSQAPSHHSSRGTRAAPPPTAPYSLAALRATAAPPAQRPSLPTAGFLCLRRAVPPGVFPGLPSPGHPSPRCLPTPCRVGAGELRSWKTHARVQKGESAGEEQGVGDKGWRGLGKEGRGVRWRGGESKLSPLGK